jgi:hypothetical protein
MAIATNEDGLWIDPHRLHRRRRPGQAWSCRRPRPAGQQPDRCQFFFAGELAAKRLEFLRELVPGATRIAILVNPPSAAVTASTLRDVEAAARAIRRFQERADRVGRYGRGIN